MGRKRTRPRDTYYVEAILATRRDDAGEEEFLIRWIGYGPDGDTWEPANHLQPGLIAEFKAAAAPEPHLPADDQLLVDEPEDVAGSQASVSADEHWRAMLAETQSAAAEERAQRQLCTPFSTESSTSREELGSAAQPDGSVFPNSSSLSEPLEAQPGGEHAATPELARAAGAEPTQPTSGTEQPAEGVSREKRYQANRTPCGRNPLLCNFVEDGKNPLLCNFVEGGKNPLLCNFVEGGKQCCEQAQVEPDAA